MNTVHTSPVHSRSAVVVSTLALAVLLSTGCSGMTHQEKSTAIGAGVGAVGGAILTGGGAVGTLGTLGGAAVGGVIGHELNKDK